MGLAPDPEVAAAVRHAAHLLAGMGHHVEEADPAALGLDALRSMMDIWFFGFDVRLAGYAQRTGLQIGPDTLEPMTWKICRHARQMKPAHFMAAVATLNTVRRRCTCRGRAEGRNSRGRG